MKRLVFPAALLALLAVLPVEGQSILAPAPADARVPSRADANALVLRAVARMPRGRGYSVGSVASAKFRAATRIAPDGRLAVDPSGTGPSFCSSATYLVFLRAISEMEAAGQIDLPASARRQLLAGAQPDGTGIWGRWNANGPGTARLFAAAGIGKNFTSLAEALPGDFLKIWWTDAIGARERGHSVVFLGAGRNEKGEPAIRYWSSNQPGGYGESSAPLSRVRHLLFSRLTAPARLARVTTLPETDPYLASMLRVDESFAAMLPKVRAEN